VHFIAVINVSQVQLGVSEAACRCRGVGVFISEALVAL
jgi:hypothetical protein